VKDSGLSAIELMGDPAESFMQGIARYRAVFNPFLKMYALGGGKHAAVKETLTADEAEKNLMKCRRSR